MNIRSLALGLALAVTGGFVAAAAAPAGAQVAVQVEVGPHGVPAYQTWQPAWDRFQYDRRHVMLGTVADFQPFRLQLARPNGVVQMIDLKDGTVILPTGATPTTNERVAIVGYYSRGTFIANRVLIHP
jgi:hypothetical protein